MMPNTARFVALALIVTAAQVRFATAAIGAPPQEELELAWRHFRAAERYAASPERLDRYRQVEELARRVAEVDPASADAQFLLFASRGRRILAGNPLMNLTKLGGLNHNLDQALELDPEHPDALAAKGGLLLGLPSFLGGDTEQALAYLQKAVALNPSGPGTRIEYARALLREGRSDEAHEQLLYAGHYACLTRRSAQLAEAEHMLEELDRAAAAR